MWGGGRDDAAIGDREETSDFQGDPRGVTQGTRPGNPMRMSFGTLEPRQVESICGQTF